MEKVKEIMIKSAEHSFYCDECGKYLGTSQEYDDGFYEEIGEFELSLHIDDWYRIKKCLCNDCRRIFIENLKVALKNIGFEKE